MFDSKYMGLSMLHILLRIHVHSGINKLGVGVIFPKANCIDTLFSSSIDGIELLNAVYIND